MRSQLAHAPLPPTRLRFAVRGTGTFAVLLLGGALALEGACALQGASLVQQALQSTRGIDPLLDFARPPLERLYAILCLLGPLIALRARSLALHDAPSALQLLGLARGRGQAAAAVRAAAGSLAWSLVAPAALFSAWVAMGGELGRAQTAAATAVYLLSILLVEAMPAALLDALRSAPARAALAASAVALTVDALGAPGSLARLGRALVETVHGLHGWGDDLPRAFAARLWLAAMAGAALVLTWLGRRGDAPRLLTALLVGALLVLSVFAG